MTFFSATSNLLGGLGLFLTGMWLMTDGLKLAAGEQLRGILHSWTKTALRGLLTGFFITALVQSSSAITVATIGFANAGLITLPQAVWVIYGSNIGTTMTGWLVALIGFKVNIDAYALPLIGIGMLIRLTGQKSRRAAIGQTILGFGLFFLGISVLKEAFATAGSGITLPSVREAGVTLILLYMLLGMILTTLMQSSSAAIVVTLSAASAGVVPLGAAAATVIGANLGTTTTAVLSAIGATSTAKRVAFSHVLFNVITALVALILLKPMLVLTSWLQETMLLNAGIPATIAIFHTVFNVLGVLLMWPLADRMIKFLSGRFISKEELASKPLYLDQTALEVPALASVALMKETGNLNQQVVAIAMAAVSSEGEDSDRFIIDQANIEKLASAIGGYVAQLGRTHLPEDVANHLPELIRVAQQYVLISELASEVVVRQKNIHLKPEQEQIMQKVAKMKQNAASLLKRGMISKPEFDPELLQQRYAELEDDYDTVKMTFLRAGADGSMGMLTIDNQIDQANLIKRIARQLVKVTRLQSKLTTDLGIDPATLVSAEPVN